MNEREVVFETAVAGWENAREIPEDLSASELKELLKDADGLDPGFRETIEQAIQERHWLSRILTWLSHFFN